MNDSQAASLRVLIHDHLGIAIPVAKQYLLEARIAKALRHLSLDNPDDLIQGLRRGDVRMWNALAQDVTTGHTYFLRETEHFDRMVGMVRRYREPRDIKIWVAASSSGEEVYSIAMALTDAGISGFRILASDINTEFLVQLKEGRYGAGRFSGMSASQRDRYFRPAGKDRTGETVYQAIPQLRNHVMARRINLLDRLRFEVSFDFIFCRNVFMYFDRETQKRVLATLLVNLRPDGILFMGQSENLFGLTDGLVSPGPGAYQRKDAHEKETRTDHR